MKKETFSNRIREALYLAKMTASELCRVTGIPKSAMSQYINGKFEPKQDRLFLIAKALKVDVAWLMGFNVPRVESDSSDNSVATNDYLLLNKYHKLNELGKKRANTYIDDLLENKKYTGKIIELNKAAFRGGAHKSSITEKDDFLASELLNNEED